MKFRIILFLLTVCCLSCFAKTVVAAGKMSEIEWKNNVIEFRRLGKHAGKVVIVPRFTNGEKIENARAAVLDGPRPGLTLRGKNCSLTFVLSSRQPLMRVSVPRNAAFDVKTDTQIVVLPDLRGEDTILEPGKYSLNVPGILPFFMGLQKGENWTLSCIPAAGRSDIRLSADLKTWSFTPGTLEEYIFYIHSAPKVWHRLQEKLQQNIRKRISWKAPFPARYQFAMPMAREFIDWGYLPYTVWSAGELTVPKNYRRNVPPRVAILNTKTMSAWSSACYSSFPYPVRWSSGGLIDTAYPLHRKKMYYDVKRPIYIYTYDSGSYNKRGFPVDCLDLYTKAEFVQQPATGSLSIGPATCDMTYNVIEKIFYRSEARTQRQKLVSSCARMQLFVEGIRARIDNYRSWADGCIRLCGDTIKKDPAAAKELTPVINVLGLIEKDYTRRLPVMKTTEEALALQTKLLQDVDNNALDDEALEERAKTFGKATRTIGGSQDNCVAMCRYITKRCRQLVLLTYMKSSNRLVKEVCLSIYRSGAEIMKFYYSHEGK